MHSEIGNKDGNVRIGRIKKIGEEGMKWSRKKEKMKQINNENTFEKWKKKNNETSKKHRRHV